MYFFEYTFAFKRKSTQKLTDLPEVKEKFWFPLLRKRTAEAQFDSSFQHQVLLMRWTKSIHCLDSLTNYSGCMSNLIFLASVKAVMTNITCFLSIFVMFLKHTPFSRAYYCFKFTLHPSIYYISALHQCVFSPDIFWQFCRESITFSWPLILWSVFLPISFTLQKQFFSILNKTLLQSSYFGALHCIKLTLSNASSGNASHLTTGHVSKSKRRG